MECHAAERGSESDRRPSPGRREGRRHRALWWSLGALVPAVLAACAAYSLFSGDGSAPSTTYATSVVERGDLIAKVAASANLRPLTQVDISSELNGTMQAVFVVENQRVTRGQVLAQLDATARQVDVESAQASVQAAAAQLSDARISLDEAQRKLERATVLHRTSLVTEQKLEELAAARRRAANKVTAAEADLAIRRAQLKLRQLDFTRSTLRAPIDGIILARKTDPGQTVVASTQAPLLFTLAEDLERMELVAAINEADIGQIRKGQKASFTVDAFPDRLFDAEIRDISYSFSTNKGIVSYEARLDVTNAELKLRPGMTAALSIITGEARDALLVSSAAFRYRPAGAGDADAHVSRDGLYVLADGEPRRVSVETGVSSWEKTEILSGLEEGMTVITGDGPAAAP